MHVNRCRSDVWCRSNLTHFDYFSSFVMSPTSFVIRIRILRYPTLSTSGKSQSHVIVAWQRTRNRKMVGFLVLSQLGRGTLSHTLQNQCVEMFRHSGDLRKSSSKIRRDSLRTYFSRSAPLAVKHIIFYFQTILVWHRIFRILYGNWTTQRSTYARLTLGFPPNRETSNINSTAIF